MQPGSGPAGCTAALCTARAQLKALIFGGANRVGGTPTTTTGVENSPGSPDGIDGIDGPMADMHAQAGRSGAEVIDDDIVSADVTTDIETVSDTTGTMHRAKSVIVPTGSGCRKLDIPKEDELSDRGVSWCATRDGFLFHDRDIVVVGGDDTVMEEATFLTRFVRSITVVHRGSSLWAYQVMQNPDFSDEKIFFAFDTGIRGLKEEGGKLSGLVLHDVFTGKTRDPDVTGLSSPSATIPAANCSKGRPDLDHNGCIKAGRGRRGGVR
ncbi:NAD(P)/FAD-dependent oxidoreductase [Streptomyces sp. NPDC059224]|uniref:NAD(P)/FAD-dependent oxidoreductase n=1 Tax=Streptomyces sp. NPDC059224 TaxID=3346775 RepID=UPI00367DA9A8